MLVTGIPFYVAARWREPAVSCVNLTAGIIPRKSASHLGPISAEKCDRDARPGGPEAIVGGWQSAESVPQKKKISSGAGVVHGPAPGVTASAAAAAPRRSRPAARWLRRSG